MTYTHLGHVDTFSALLLVISILLTLYPQLRKLMETKRTQLNIRLPETDIELFKKTAEELGYRSVTAMLKAAVALLREQENRYF